MGERLFIVMSGLPASGKTTLARALAPILRLPVIDKDDILEGLFDSLGVGDLVWRQKLSRASDAVLARLVEASTGAIIVSFWRHDGTESDSGTPLQWLRQLEGKIVEVHCQCPADLAEQRFIKRSRHAGHQDAARSPQALRRQFNELASKGPVNAGASIVVETGQTYDLSALTEQIRQLSSTS